MALTPKEEQWLRANHALASGGKPAGSAQPTLDDLIRRDPSLADLIRDTAHQSMFDMAYARIGDSCGDYRHACDTVLGEIKTADAEADKAMSSTIQALLTMAIFFAAPGIGAIVAKTIPAAAAQIGGKVVETYLKSATVSDKQFVKIAVTDKAIRDWLIKGFDHHAAEAVIEAGWHACKEKVEVHVGETENECVYEYLKTMADRAEVMRNGLQKALSQAMTSYSQAAAILGALQDTTTDSYLPFIREQVEHFRKQIAPVLEQIARGGPKNQKVGDRRQGEEMDQTTELKFVKILMHGEWRVAQIKVITLDTGYGDVVTKNFESWVDDDVLGDIGKDRDKLETIDLKQLKGTIPPPPQHRHSEAAF